MKKLLSIALALLLIVSVAACGSYKSNGATPPMAAAAGGSSEEYYAYDRGEVETGYSDGSYGYADAPAAAPAPGYTTDTGSGGLTGLLVSSSGTGSLAEKIIYSAYATVETVKFDESLEALAAMIGEYAAFVENSYVTGADYASTYYGNNPYRYANFTIRVPRENYAALTGNLSKIGNVTNLSNNAENVTEQYTDVESRLKVYRVEESRLLAMLEKADTVADMITIESTLSQVRYEIESLTSRLTNLDNRVNYSSVSVDIREVEILSKQEPVHLTYGQQILEGLRNTLGGIGHFFKNLLKFIIVNLPIFAILAVVIIAVVLVIVKRRPKKTEKPEKTDEEK
ncbi:MAG: DUF4349 domain-containing protein [Oscillospiraceae bacterium]|jgi:hypothetical protein|nr:DUF4349 domain-containing protein [Oscillospiraceae bacterium]